MKTKFKFLLGLVMLALTIGFTACEGDQGEIGPKGDTGAQGEQGVPGEQGPKGESGGTEAASFGNVELTISGFNYEGDAYTKVVDYKYIVANNPGSSMLMEYDGVRRFDIAREYRITAKENAKTLSSEMINTLHLRFAEEGGVLTPESFYFSATILENQQVYFVDHNSYLDETENNFTISDYSYDAATGVLKFNFTYSFTHHTGEVELTGKADVIVYKANPA